MSQDGDDMSRITLWIGISLLVIGVTATAETYRWVDAEGKVHYSDRPVQGAQEIKVKVPGDVPESPMPAAEPADETQPAAVNNGADAGVEIRAKLCNDAKARLASYEKADGIYEETAEGRRALSIDERVDAIVKARQSVQETCGPPAS